MVIVKILTITNVNCYLCNISSTFPSALEPAQQSLYGNSYTMTFYEQIMTLCTCGVVRPVKQNMPI